tara:strand:- start:2576 stop:3247 length:672 start_codon:yes stop_codon:yes gene_type:complete
MVAAPGQFMGGTAGPNADDTGGLFQGLSNFLMAGGTIDEYMIRAFPQTAGVNMKKFSALPKGLSKAAVRGGASKVGGMLSRRVPLAGGLLQAATGDPIGGAGTAIGGVVGGIVGAPFGPVGSLVGSTVGMGIGQTATRGLAGINLGDPFSGPDISIPIFGGIPISPYAKTKKAKERAREERRKDLEAMEPFLQEQLGRNMAMQQQAITGNLMQAVINASRRSK